MGDERFEGRRTMTVTLELTDAQWSAVESLLAVWNSLGSMGSSRWTAFYADGDGNFRPKATVNGSPPTHTTMIEESKLWDRDEYRIDFDAIAWPLHHGGSDAR